MLHLLPRGVRIPVNGEKIIEEYVGNASNNTDQFSVAHMLMPAGWSEPAHHTSFDELVIVVRGELTVAADGHLCKVSSDQVCWIEPSNRVRFENETAEGCEYWAICVPAFHPDRTHAEP